ncbi:PAS domain-containing sensor histidine kinase [Aestuariispira insulae]|uniref:histidine kinase n=1 Tax=Aestuariispira insulae TaxID=1461337 RepID=A0A3D9H3K3_9PROT|nr:PAS domain-containing sensor histidine kinase [Aestuariispira insulae]RED43781.1 PAS domain S-box-containing protein [Aestuariispira insulae]
MNIFENKGILTDSVVLNQAIIDTIREPLIIMDADLTVLHASRNFYEKFGVCPEETEGRPLSELGNGQWNIPSLQSLLSDILERDETIEAFEVEHSFPGIGRRIMLLNARKIHTADDQISSILLAVEDITERKEAEDALRKNRQELEQRSIKLAELVENTELLNQKLRYEIDVKNKFFSIIAHDLKSPFNSLLGMTQMMSQLAVNLSTEKLVEYAGDVNEAGKQVYQLLENLLEWSRLQMAGGELHPEITSLKEVVQDCIDIHEPAALDKDIKLENDAGKNTAYADPNMLGAVIRNLIANAVKFTPPGGMVHVSSKVVQAGIQVTVADNGIGMSADQKAKVFQLDQTTSTKGTAGEPGTGLGLPLCQSLIQRNGGRIWIESVQGQGTQVHFTLQAATATPPARA